MNDEMIRTIKRFGERWHPILIAAFTACLISFTDYKALVSINETALFEGMLGFQGILIGFLATAKSIIFSIESRELIKQMKKTTVYNKLINYFMDAINSAFLAACFSIGCLIADFNIFKTWHVFLLCLWVFTNCWSILSSYRVISKFSKILKV